MEKPKILNETAIRCYRDCRFNTFHKANCGRCVKSEIQLTSDGCMDFEKPVKKERERGPHG